MKDSSVVVMKVLSFVIPCYNSAGTIEYVIREIDEKLSTMDGYDYEVIAVDDCSPDNVYDILHRLADDNPKIKAMRFTRNFGQHAGMIAGIKESIGDVVITLDDDGQCPVDQVDELIKPLEEGYDIAFAGYGRKAQSFFKNIGSRFNEFTANVMLGKPKDIQLSNFMAFKRVIADEVKRYEGPFPYISGLLFRSGNSVANVPMAERKRIAGKSNYNLIRMIALWVSGFTTFTIKPLRLATHIGIAVAFMGIVYGIVIVCRYFFLGGSGVYGWSSLIVITTVLGGLILMVLGVIGEYIGRIYMSVNQTPQYVVGDSCNLKG